jgi:hypothetical protein
MEISGELVEKVEFLGERSCRDHSHPSIRIHFKEPSANEPFAAVFSSLLRASIPAPINPHVMMLPIEPYPGIGEWLARLFSDAVWDGGGSGGGGNSPVDILERKLCLKLRQQCRGGNMKACRLMADEC